MNRFSSAFTYLATMFMSLSSDLFFHSLLSGFVSSWLLWGVSYDETSVPGLSKLHLLLLAKQNLFLLWCNQGQEEFEVL